MATVELRGVNKGFGATPVLRDVSLTVADGEFLVLVGPSGCGKSTLLRVIAGLDEVDSGDVLIGDQRVNDIPPAKRGIAMVFQSYALYPHMSLYDNMAFGLRLMGKDRAEIDRAVNDAAALLDIEHLLDRRPKALSGGQRQRVAIARALLRDPPILILDEATSALDTASERLVQQAIDHLMRERTALVIAHRLATVRDADEIVVLDAGRVVQRGTHDELFRAGGLYRRLYDLQFRDKETTLAAGL